MNKFTALPDLDRAVIEHVIYRLRNAALLAYPFPHFVATDVFPPDYYASLAQAARCADYAPDPDGKYANRQFASPSNILGLAGFATAEFVRHALSIFRPFFGAREFSVATELRLVADAPGYKIGPHTDAAWKLISLLFYLPTDATRPDLGTSIYVPRDPSFTCPGGPHHDFEQFVQVGTAPYVPNACLGFWKTERAFHGVMPATAHRNVLLWNAYDGTHPRFKSVPDAP